MKQDANSARRRSIIWSAEADAAAIGLAREHGYYPEKMHGGVSKMLADLVASEAALKLQETPRKAIPFPSSASAPRPVRYGQKKGK